MNEKSRTYQNVSLVKEQLHELIDRQRSQQVMSLPSERTLSEMLGCNRKTLRKALEFFDNKGTTIKLSRERIIAQKEAVTRVSPKTILLIAATDEYAHDPVPSLFIQRLSGQTEYVLHTINSLNDPKDVEREFQHFLSEGVDAVFVVGNSQRLSFLEKLTDQIQFYQLRADDLFKGKGVPGVFADYYQGGYIGLNHLIMTGRKKILVITNKAEHNTEVFANFERGCSEAIEHSGNAAELSFFIQSRQVRFNEELDKGWFKKIVKEFDAVFAFEDYQLVKLHNMLLSAGVQIPQQIALLGFNNTPWSSLLHPQLSSVSPQNDIIVDKALEMMRLNHRSVEQVKPILVIRGSTVAR